MMKRKSRKTVYIGLIICILVILLYGLSGPALTQIGEFLVVDEKPVRSDAVVVLNTGLAYYPRLVEAVSLYRQGFAKKIVINGNRKTEVLRELERKGYQPCCPWYENRLRILELLGVPRKGVIAISAEDAYDTVSEAIAVGKELLESGVKSVIITTSKSHTRRAHYIWKNACGGRLKIRMVAAKSDPYSPSGWWKSGRQIRWVLAEYGAWAYYFWKM